MQPMQRIAPRGSGAPRAAPGKRDPFNPFDPFDPIQVFSSLRSLMPRLARRLTLVSLVALAGCERVVTMEVAEGPRRLVVEARVERVRGAITGAQRVRLTTTGPYFSAGSPPPATGAVVRVTDQLGTVTAFVEQSSEPGVYRTASLVGVVGRRYTLTIDWNGDRYESTERLAAVPPIELFYFDKPLSGLESNPGPRVTIGFADPSGVKNWYMWELFVERERVLGPDPDMLQPVVSNDEAFDGRRIGGFQPYEGIVIPAGANVLFRQYGISEEVYRYLFALGEQTTNDGSPFAVPAASVRGNVVNRTNPSRFPLGYFMASEVSEAVGVAPR